jgi:hypothetical protein
MTDRQTAPAPRLTDLARPLGQLRPDWANPERYFENRNEIERELRRLAKHLDQR